MRRDDVIARVQRLAVLCGAVLTAGALAAYGRHAAVSVLGGGVLSAVSLLLITRSIVDLTAFAEGARDPSSRPNTGRAMVKMTSRYALLAFLAYVMIARLRLSPVGLIVGASSVVAAAAIEAGRLLRNHK